MDKPQISPLRYAPVEMTKGRVVMARSRGLGYGQTADLSTALRSGRDDKGKGRYGPQQRPRYGQTADLSPALRSGRDDKGKGRYGPQQRSRYGQTADLSTALRSGRDDKGKGRY